MKPGRTTLHLIPNLHKQRKGNETKNTLYLWFWKNNWCYNACLVNLSEHQIHIKYQNDIHLIQVPSERTLEVDEGYFKQNIKIWQKVAKILVTKVAYIFCLWVPKSEIRGHWVNIWRVNGWHIWKKKIGDVFLVDRTFEMPKIRYCKRIQENYTLFIQVCAVTYRRKSVIGAPFAQANRDSSLITWINMRYTLSSLRRPRWIGYIYTALLTLLTPWLQSW